MTTDMTTDMTADAVRDPDLPGRLLAGERDALIPLLRSRPDAATLVRLYSGRPVEGRAYELAGAEARELNIFG